MSKRAGWGVMTSHRRYTFSHLVSCFCTSFLHLFLSEIFSCHILAAVVKLRIHSLLIWLLVYQRYVSTFFLEGGSSVRLKFQCEANARIFLMKQGQIKTGAPCRSERLAKYNQARILQSSSRFHIFLQIVVENLLPLTYRHFSSPLVYCCSFLDHVHLSR